MYRSLAERREIMTYRWLPHTADLLAHIASPTFQGILEDAALVVRDLLVGGSPVISRETRHIDARGPDRAELLFAFLRGLLEQYYLDRFVPERAVPGQVVQDDGGYRLRTAVTGERFDPSRHAAQPEVKAVTRHALRVERCPDGWIGEVVFDV
ncbi:MAG TPA: archease [Gemmatimonadales bacterium]|nr:archease [Gemmatimonadales bacterium]